MGAAVLSGARGDSGSDVAKSGTTTSGSTPPTTKIAGQPNTVITSRLASKPPAVNPTGTAPDSENQQPSPQLRWR